MYLIYKYCPEINATSIEYSPDHVHDQAIQVIGTRIIKLIPGDHCETVKNVLNGTYPGIEKLDQDSFLDYERKSPNDPIKVQKQMDNFIMDRIADVTNSDWYSDFVEIRFSPGSNIKKIKGQEVKPLILDFRTITTTDRKYTEFYLDKICELGCVLKLENPKQVFEIVFPNSQFESWVNCIDLEECVMEKADEYSLTIIQSEGSRETILRIPLPTEGGRAIDIKSFLGSILPLFGRILGIGTEAKISQEGAPPKLPPIK